MQKSADQDANIIVGAVIDENLKDEILITVIATGFDKSPVMRKIDKKAEKSPAKQEQAAPRRQLATDISEDELEIPTFLRKNRFR